MPFLNHVPNIDFLAHRRKAALASITWLLISLVLIVVRGPSWGIDFTGGTEIRLRFQEQVSIEQVRASVGAANIEADSVQQVGSDEGSEYVVRVQDPTFGSAELTKKVDDALLAAFGADWIAESAYDAEVGTRMTVRYTGAEVSVERIEEALAGVEGATVEKTPDDNTVHVKLPSLSASVQETLERSIDQEFEVLQVDSVGPSVGKELRTQGFLAVGITCLLILVYVAFRFDFVYAPGAVIGILHDVVNVVGVFILLDILGIYRADFNLPMVGALLTILGYSINDTIVIYDRMRENHKKFRRKPLQQIMNESLNETLSRTIGTGMTTMLAMTPFLILGSEDISNFALAIILGVIFGTYSTVYVASPLTLVFDRLRPSFARVIAGGEQVELKEGGTEALTESERRRREREARLAERQGKDHP